MHEKTRKINPLSPGFWKDYSRKISGNSQERYLKGMCWDKAASTYDDLESCGDYMHQVNTVIETLRQHGALSQETRVLDVACGTGTYALRMAPHCKEVVALDVSQGMLKRLEEKQTASGIKNIKIVQADWNHFSCDEKFDLVFASMTPLFQSLENIDRFLENSDRFLSLVCWAGIRENHLLNRLYDEILGRRPQKGHKSDIIVLFNYLYSKGYAPNLIFFHGCWERIRSVDKQAENLIWRMEMVRPLKPDEKELIKKRVRELEQDGLVRIYTKVRIGFMLLDKQKYTVPCPPKGTSEVS